MKQIYLDVNKELYNEIFDLESDSSLDSNLIDLIGYKDKKEKKASKTKKSSKKHIITICKRKSNK